MHNSGRRSHVATLVAVVAVVAGNAAIAQEVRQPQPPARVSDSAAPPSPPPPVVNQGQGQAAPGPASPRPSGFVAIPYLGLNSLSGDGATGTSTGLRVGALLGGHVAEIFSFNGELTLDAVNRDAPAGASASMYIVQLGISPLFHVDTPRVRFVAGPKVGVWGHTGSVSSGGFSVDDRGLGWTLGLNAGLFIPVKNTTSLGILLSYATLNPVVACASGTGIDEDCTGDNLKSSQVLGLTLGALF
jgi:hypothetical protein